MGAAEAQGGELVNRETFDAQMGRLIVLKGWPDSVEEYFPALVDIPDDLMPDAVTHALRTRTWFPAPAEVRADCDAIRRSRPVSSLPQPKVHELAGGGREVLIANPFGGEPLRLLVTRDWTHDCEECSDTGWASRWCGEGRSGQPDVKSRHCGRTHLEHGAHEFVEKCACIDWNPTIKRRKEAQAKYSSAPEKVEA
jgi:hypothetical protein